MPSFQDPELQRISLRCFCNPRPATNTFGVERPPKRVRLATVNGDESIKDVRSNIVCYIYSLLGLQVNMALTGLSQNAAYVTNIPQIYLNTEILKLNSDCFPKLSEEEQCSLYAAIGQVACASAQTLSETSVSDRGGLIHNKCNICDRDIKNNSASAPWEGSGATEVFSTIVSLIKLPKTQKFRRPRVAAMLALKRVLSHTVKEEHLDLTTSAFGQWCLQALHSSIRELRIAAG